MLCFEEEDKNILNSILEKKIAPLIKSLAAMNN